MLLNISGRVYLSKCNPTGELHKNYFLSSPLVQSTSPVHQSSPVIVDYRYHNNIMLVPNRRYVKTQAGGEAAREQGEDEDLFRLVVVNSYGSQEVQRPKDDDSIPLKLDSEWMCVLREEGEGVWGRKERGYGIGGRGDGGWRERGWGVEEEWVWGVKRGVGEEGEGVWGVEVGGLDDCPLHLLLCYIPRPDVHCM